MKVPSALSLLSIGFVGLVARPACGATVDGLLRARGEEYADWTPSIKYVPIIRGIEGRQITTSCVTAGWIPCTAYASDRGCRPPGGTCCIDGNYCENGKDCVDIPGQSRGGCCARGLTCAGSTRECKTGGSSLCPEKDYCCAADYICGHSSTGIGSTCNLNVKAGATTTPPRATTTPRTTTTPWTSTTRTSTSRTPTPTPATGGTQTLATDVNAGAIAGGVVGGVVLIVLIGLLIFYKRRRAAADAAVMAAAHAQTSAPGAGHIAPGGPGGMGYTGPGGLQGSPMMENNFGAPPIMAGSSYAGRPEIHSEPDSAYAGYGSGQVRPTSYYDANGNPMAYHPYGGVAPDSSRPISIATSLPTSPYVGIDAMGGPPFVPGRFPVSPSPGSAYSGIPGVHDAAVGGIVVGRRPDPSAAAPASPSHRFSTFSENGSIGPALHPVLNTNTPSSPGSGPSPTLPPGAGSPGSGPGLAGGFYYNSAAISPGMPSAALPTGASVGGFNPSLRSSSERSPTAGRFSTSAVMAAYQQPSTPGTPLTGSSEQGLLSNAQAVGMGQPGPSSGGVRALPSIPPEKRQW